MGWICNYMTLITCNSLTFYGLTDISRFSMHRLVRYWPIYSSIHVQSIRSNMELIVADDLTSLKCQQWLITASVRSECMFVCVCKWCYSYLCVCVCALLYHKLAACQAISILHMLFSRLLVSSISFYPSKYLLSLTGALAISLSSQLRAPCCLMSLPKLFHKMEYARNNMKRDGGRKKSERFIYLFPYPHPLFFHYRQLVWQLAEASASRWIGVSWMVWRIR